mmetsp:Transcript_21305/g.27958  ORF Transcript_21305/g.27958 Transcript_21305/m.27958 type:complete len:351 (+) Transcript_21305:222-1274(+)
MKNFIVICLLVISQFHFAFGSSEAATTSNKYFAVPAFFVLFREVLEAAIIISVLLQYLDKVGKTELKRDVWIGTAIGLGLAILMGIIFISIFYAAKNNLFTGEAEALFEGVLMLLACAIITVLGTSMIKMASKMAKYEKKMSQKVKEVMEGTNKYGMIILPLSSILREGIESIIFLAGVGASYPASSIPIPGICGAIVGSICGYLMYKAGDKLNLKNFFYASTVFLLFIAAGLCSYGIHEIQEAGAFGCWECDNRPWGNRPMYDWGPAFSYKKHEFWALVRAIFGFRGDPSPVEFISYWCYWVVVLFYISFKLRLLCFKNIPVKGATYGEEVDEVEKNESKEDVEMAVAT